MFSYFEEFSVTTPPLGIGCSVFPNGMAPLALESWLALGP